MSKRRAKRRFDRWVRYFKPYEPWHYATPGMERAYNALVHADYAQLRRQVGSDTPWASPDADVVGDIRAIGE
jgi:hypothetical protein